VTAGRNRVRPVRYGRRGRGLFALLLALAPLVGVTAARAQTAALPLTMTVTRLTPTAPQPGDLITVAGMLTNPTSVEYDKLTVVFRFSSTPLLSRTDLLAVVASTDHFASEESSESQQIDELAPGGSVPYELQVPVDQLDLTTAGVYRISVEAVQGPADNRVYDARINTFLPWIPPSAEVPQLHVAWLWPLLSTPHLEPDNTFTDDSLGAELAPRGRLGLLLGVATQAADQSGVVPAQRVPVAKGKTSRAPTPTPVKIEPVPVTPVIDPENVQELELMADPATPYQVDGVAPAKPAAGAYRDAATAYLAELKALMSKTTSIAVPYADPDIEALSHAKASSLVTQARSTGLESSLPGIVSGLVWPPDGALSENALDQLTTTGLVLSSAALPVTGVAPAYTPTASATVDRPSGTIPAIVIDDGLSTLVTKPIHGADKVLVAQRYAAETAAIAVESAPAPRTLLIAPGRRWLPTNTPVRSLLAETGRLPWLAPETVQQALQQGAPDPAVVRGPLQEPPGESTLPTGLASRIAATNAELDGFRSILCPTPKTTSSGTKATTPAAANPDVCVPAAQALMDSQLLALQRSIYRTASTAYQVPGSGADTLLSATAADLSKLERKVRIVTKGDVVLLGDRARLPISIVNELPVAVQVQLILKSTSPALRTTQAQTVTIPAGAKPQLDVTVRTARAGAGNLPVDAQLLTPDGRDFGPPAQLRVRVSVYGAVVVWISIAVGGLLVLAVIVRLYRRIRNARRGSPTPIDDTPFDGEPLGTQA
jgi:Family of unknown function (DUF6049)